MKKVSLFIWALAGAVSWGHAQNPAAVLDVNQIRTTIYPKNSLFWNGENLPGYEVPAGSGKYSLYSSNLWLVGKDANDLYHGYYNRYGFDAVDTLPGPLTLSGGTTTPAIAQQYKRVWKINQWEIDLLRQAQSNGQLASGAYTAPPDIAGWPANAPAAGYADNLAPYHDQNGDNVYDIMDGDYPIIKGEQMVYFILNDRGTAYDQGVDVPIQTGLEIHVSLYACKKEGAADSTDVVNYTGFVEYQIFNRGTVQLSNLYVGFNSDGDLGYPLDDYVGSHVDADAFYFYNGNVYDGMSISDTSGYGLNSPVQSVQFLESHSGIPDMAYFMSYQNSSGATGDPLAPSQYHNYLSGYWNNGGHLVYGGNGFPGGQGATALQARYMFPGISDPANTGTNGTDPGFLWTQPAPCPSCVPNAPGDQRGVGSTGPFTLLPGGNLRLTLGLITTFDSTLTISERIDKNRQQNKWLKQWYDNGDLPCVMSPAPLSDPDVPAVASLQVYPNPATDVVRISGTAVQAGISYELVDIHGRRLRTGNGLQQGMLDISVHDLSAGIYFIRLHGSGQTQTVKFIKQQ